MDLQLAKLIEWVEEPSELVPQMGFDFDTRSYPDETYCCTTLLVNVSASYYYFNLNNLSICLLFVPIYTHYFLVSNSIIGFQVQH
jgi:hypothetical protein